MKRSFNVGCIGSELERACSQTCRHHFWYDSNHSLLFFRNAEGLNRLLPWNGFPFAVLWWTGEFFFVHFSRSLPSPISLAPSPLRWRSVNLSSHKWFKLNRHLFEYVFTKQRWVCLILHLKYCVRSSSNEHHVPGRNAPSWFWLESNQNMSG